MSIHAKIDSVAVGSTALAPTADSTVATTGVIPAGVYRVLVGVVNVGTQETTAAGLKNAVLRNGVTKIVDIPTTGQHVTLTLERVTMDGASSLSVKAQGNATAGSAYCATISVQRVV